MGALTHVLWEMEEYIREPHKALVTHVEQSSHILLKSILRLSETKDADEQTCVHFLRFVKTLH
jgi:hypothetical protein